MFGQKKYRPKHATRWSFYKLLHDYKQDKDAPSACEQPGDMRALGAPADLPLASIPAPVEVGSRRVNSAPPRPSSHNTSSIPLVRSGSDSTGDRRVRFADDGLVRVHHFAPIQPDSVTGAQAPIVPMAGQVEDDGEEADVEDGDEEEVESDERLSTTLSQWLDRQREIRGTPSSYSYLSPGQHVHGLGLDLPHFPTPPTSSAGNTLRSSASWGGGLPLTPSLSRSPDPSQATSDIGHSAINGVPGTPLPPSDLFSPSPVPSEEGCSRNDDEVRDRVHEKGKERTASAPDQSEQKRYEIRRHKDGKSYRWSIDKYPFPQVLDYDNTDMRARYSYFSPVTTDDEVEDDDADEDAEAATHIASADEPAKQEESDEEMGCITEAQSARMSAATLISPPTSPTVTQLASPLSMHSVLEQDIMNVSPTPSIRRAKALRVKRRHTGTNTLPRAHTSGAGVHAITSTSSPSQAEVPSRRMASDARHGVFAIMQQERAIMQGAALVAAERRRRTMSAPRTYVH